MQQMLEDTRTYTREQRSERGSGVHGVSKRGEQFTRMNICNDARSTLMIAYSYIDYLQSFMEDAAPLEQLRWRNFNERIHVEAMQLEYLLARLEKVKADSIHFVRLTNRLLLSKSRVNGLIRNAQDEMTYA